MGPHSSDSLEASSSVLHLPEPSVALEIGPVNPYPLSEDPIVSALQRLLAQEGGHIKVGDEAGVSDQSLYQIALMKADSKTGNPKGVGPSIRKRLTARYPGWLDGVVRPPSDGGEDTPVAHGLSPRPFTVPPLVTWEAVVQKQNLPAQFTLEVPDNALAPNAPKGTPLIFDCSAAPRPGYAVLVEDKSGARWVRRYKQEPDGAWLAEAVNPAYATLDPEKHGLRIVAAMLFKDAAL